MSEDIHGLSQLVNNLNDLPLALGTQKNLIVRALRAGAEPIRARAAEMAPDDPTTPWSRIKENMMITVSDQTANGAVAKIGPSRKGFVGQFSEWGTSRQSAKPFLKPAYDEKLDEAVRIIGETLADGIEKEMKKL